MKTHGTLIQIILHPDFYQDIRTVVEIGINPSFQLHHPLLPMR